LGPRFFPFFRLFLSLGFFSWSADGGMELFDEERFFSLSNASFNCSISCCFLFAQTPPLAIAQRSCGEQLLKI
jgi:hypothetical protein